MSSAPNTRKRPAPGSSPVQQQALTRTSAGQPMQFPGSDADFLQWSAGASNLNPSQTGADLSGVNGMFPGMDGISNYNLRQPLPNNLNSAQANQLVRRSQNQLLARPGYGNAQWEEEPSLEGQMEEAVDEEADLDRQAADAKAEHLAHRKPIPPFVQKLAKFLNDTHNNSLIKWSDDGKSFLVLDEDEFAKRLIPEMFKHNNYASFVRQLNMYGFHKKVGLTDNSMRSNERNKKTPSEYSHRFFRQDKPDWLYLINKPKNTGAKGRNTRSRKSGEKGSDEEGENEDENYDNAGNANANNNNNSTSGGLITTGSRALQSGQDIDAIQQQISVIKQSQRLIAQKFDELRSENLRLYQQARHWEDLHTRHENSINAILSFLATVYNRNLDQGHGGNQNMPMNMNALFGGNAMTPEKMQANVINVDDFDNSALGNSGALQRSRRRQPLRLPAPETATETNNNRSSPSPAPNFRRQSFNQGAAFPVNDAAPRRQQSGTIEEIPDSSVGGPSPEDFPTASTDWQKDNNFITALNNGTPLDFDAQDSLQGTQPLTPTQRTKMLNLMTSTAGDSPIAGVTSNVTTPPPQSSGALPPPPASYPSPKLEELRDHIFAQNEQVRNLADLAGRMSPGGDIPSFGDNSELEPLNFDSFLNDDFFTNNPAFESGNGFDGEGFTFEDDQDDQNKVDGDLGGMSNETTQTVEGDPEAEAEAEVDDDKSLEEAAAKEQAKGSPAKRRRRR